MTQSILIDYCEPPYQGTALTYLTDRSGDVDIDFFHCEIRERGCESVTRHEIGQSGGSPSSLDDKIILIVGRNARAALVLEALTVLSNQIHDYGLAKTSDFLMNVDSLRRLDVLTD